MRMEVKEILNKLFNDLFFNKFMIKSPSFNYFFILYFAFGLLRTTVLLKYKS